jgi:hypothetical protein
MRSVGAKNQWLVTLPSATFLEGLDVPLSGPDHGSIPRIKKGGRLLHLPKSHERAVVRGRSVGGKCCNISDACADQFFRGEPTPLRHVARKAFRAVFNIQAISCFRYSVRVADEGFSWC